LFEQFYNFGVITGKMRERTVLAVFDGSSVMFDHYIIAGTVIHRIQRTVAEEAVNILTALVTRVELTVFICKKSG